MAALEMVVMEVVLPQQASPPEQEGEEPVIMAVVEEQVQAGV